MISLRPYDAGTLPRVISPGSVPGCDEAYYRQVRHEEGQFEDRRTAIDAEIRQVVPFTMRPWPEEMPGKMWVDLCQQYAFEADGLPFTLHHYDSKDGSEDEVPAGTGHLDLAPDEILLPHEMRSTRNQSIAEVQETLGSSWFRLLTRNEDGGTRLLRPARIMFDNLRGPAYRFEVKDNSLWAPFDLRLGLDAYRGFYDDGTACPDDVTAAAMSLTQRSRWALYLVPRRWRWVVTLVAHYVYVTWFEVVYNDEIFLRTHFDRPPVYPYRHDVLHTSQDYPLTDFWGNPCSYDHGIDYAFAYSRSAAELAHEMLAQQFFTPCLAYIFVGHEYAKITVWKRPPRQGQIVCGLGRLDAGGDESRIWLRQVVDLSSRYQQQVLGDFISTLFTVDPTGG